MKPFVLNKIAQPTCDCRSHPCRGATQLPMIRRRAEGNRQRGDYVEDAAVVSLRNSWTVDQRPKKDDSALLKTHTVQSTCPYG